MVVNDLFPLKRESNRVLENTAHTLSTSINLTTIATGPLRVNLELSYKYYFPIITLSFIIHNRNILESYLWWQMVSLTLHNCKKRLFHGGYHTVVCGWLFEHAKHITMNIIPRKHFFKIFSISEALLIVEWENDFMEPPSLKP